MPLKNFILPSSKTRDAKRKLEVIDRNALRNFLGEDFDKPSIGVSTVESIFTFIGPKTAGFIDNFVNNLRGRANISLFVSAIKSQAMSASTKKQGFFYRLIYNCIKDLPGHTEKEINEFFQRESNKDTLQQNIKLFLLGKNDKEIVEESDQAPKPTAGVRNNIRRTNQASAIEKLKSKRMSKVLKVFMALVLWKYLEQLPESEATTTSERPGEKRKAESESEYGRELGFDSGSGSKSGSAFVSGSNSGSDSDSKSESEVDRSDEDAGFRNNLPDFKSLLFTEKIYYPSKPKSELFKYAKDVILHAFLCFIAVCKYAYLIDENYGKALQEQLGFPLDKIDWDESFIKSLNTSSDWESKITKLKYVGVISEVDKIEEEKGIENLIRFFKSQKPYELPTLSRTDDAKLEALEEQLSDVVSHFNLWQKQTLVELKLIDTNEIIGEMKSEDSKFDKIRKDLGQSEENDEINKSLVKKWAENKLDDTGKRKSLSKTFDEANAAFEKLKDAGILLDQDNSRGDYHTYGSGPFSENFVKLFIRYLERSFPDLDDCVKIYYSLQTPSGRSATHYWDKIRYLKYASKSDGMIYFVINQATGDKGTGHANLAIVCNGKYKLFEPSTPAVNLPKIFDFSKGGKKYKKLTGNALGLIQRDSNNCVTITLGYVESLMKQISKEKKAQGADKKDLSSHLLGEIDKYTTVALPSNVDLAVLVPMKYVKYFQSMRGIVSLLCYAKRMDEHDPDYAIMQDVKNELDKVLKKYGQEKQPVLSAIADVASLITPRFRDSALSYFDKCVSLGLFSKDVTYGEMNNIFYDIKRCSIFNRFKDDQEDSSKVLSSKKLIEEGRVDWARDMLQKSNILKLISKGDVAEITYSDIREIIGAINSSHLTTLLEINYRAQMKRRTETLKIATLVDVLGDDKDAVQKEMSAVRAL